MLEKINKPDIEIVERQIRQIRFSTAGAWIRYYTWKQPQTCAALLTSGCGCNICKAFGQGWYSTP